MTIYAVMKTGGKEYRVAPGDVVRVEKLAAAPGATVEIREVYSIETGQGITVGSPTVADARVVAEVIEEGRGEKIVTFKKKRGNRYQMIMDDVQSYTALRIREIVAGENVPAAAAPRRHVAAAATPPPPPPPTSKPERRVTEPQTEVASEEPVGTSSTETPPVRVTPPPRVETAAPAPALDERGPRKRSYGIPGLVVALLVIAAGLLVWGSRQPPGPVEAATLAASPEAAPSSVAQPAAKAPPRKEAAINKPAAASAPSAPVQPPE